VRSTGPLTPMFLFCSIERGQSQRMPPVRRRDASLEAFGRLDGVDLLGLLLRED
jgi:hypothetical protein